MSRSGLLRLFLLASIWGASFIFMRVLAPAIGAPLTVSLRLLLAGCMPAHYRGHGLRHRGGVGWKQATSA